MTLDLLEQLAGSARELPGKADSRVQLESMRVVPGHLLREDWPREPEQTLMEQTRTPLEEA